MATKITLPNKAFAHSGLASDRSDWQPLESHLHAVAFLAAKRASLMGLTEAAKVAGALHDFGKYAAEFDKVLQGLNIRFDHSTDGAKHAIDTAPPALMPVAEVIAQAILGHHAGLPDSVGDAGSMARRLDGFRCRVSPEVIKATTVDVTEAGDELAGKLRRGAHPGFDLSVAGRMVFSCLVDADYRDTEAFYDHLEDRERPRDWGALQDCLPALRSILEARFAGFDVATGVNRLRAEILGHVRARASMAPGLFTLTVPTGGGKTLASLAFALDHAEIHGHRRIIYAIPYTSIIDQTATQFRDLFGDIVLEHHSAIDAGGGNPEGREKLRLAMEDWAAPLVVTTNVQLFESLFAARPSRCRKLHNIAGSVIVLDEAQCLPRGLLRPTLRMIDTLAAQYGCSVILCTATQPAFDSRQLTDAGLALEGRELAPDPQGLARRLRRATIRRAGAIADADLVSALKRTGQGVVIVNRRDHALSLFEQGKAEGLDGLVHLTTRQHAWDRSGIIADIRARLGSGKPCRLIATSLIEAGVDLDFPVGWRAEAGLDSVVQAAGRVNREGKRAAETSVLTVFATPDWPTPASLKVLASAMNRTADRFEDLLSVEAINDWFSEVYWRAGPEVLDGHGILKMFTLARSGAELQYRTAAMAYRMIEQVMVPVIVPTEDIARAAVENLAIESIPSGKLASQLQRFTVQVPERARAEMLRNGRAAFVAPNVRGDQFCVLTDTALYRPETGLWWEGAGYLGDGVW